MMLSTQTDVDVMPKDHQGSPDEQMPEETHICKFPEKNPYDPTAPRGCRCGRILPATESVPSRKLW